MITIVFLVGILVLFVLGGYAVNRTSGKAPAAGTGAPDFTLGSENGEKVSLHDYRGKWVVLYFYPKDFTSGCTIEAHNFQRDLVEYEKRGAVILGVSVQDEKSHQAFCTKEGLHFKLLADAEKKVSEEYGSAVNLLFTKISSRHTFLIDPQGVIRKVWLNVNVQTHSQEVLAALNELQKSPVR
ncbi:MAG TPA: peroxiredoxin [Terriglobales bacterium]|nr:peroxiredoxin [Terriglobales bacterium]